MTNLDDIRSLIFEVLALEDRNLGADEDIQLLDGWDSVNHLRIFMAVEARVGATIPMKEFFACHTLREILSIIA